MSHLLLLYASPATTLSQVLSVLHHVADLL
jgi:hypothetical protein